MFFYDQEAGFVPDDGQNDVKDGSVENYPLDWENADAGAVPDPAAPCSCACPGGAAAALGSGTADP